MSGVSSLVEKMGNKKGTSKVKILVGGLKITQFRSCLTSTTSSTTTMAGECLGSMRLRLLLQRPLRLQHRPPWVRYALHAAAATRLRLRRTKQRRPLWVRRALHAAAATHPRLRRAKQRRSLPRSPPPNHSWTKRQIPPKIRFRKFVKLTDHTAK